MNIKVISPQRLLFEGEAKSVFLRGDHGEFELLDHHAPLISLLGEGSVIIDWERHIPLKKGIAKFQEDECLVLIEA